MEQLFIIKSKKGLSENRLYNELKELFKDNFIKIDEIKGVKNEK